mmetsp:Transcript_25880/g.58317  ORF Transcript_25880/g.58317 Transcript_25880/m.58317 type:complete len:107 (-) Transcript_25880:936-1256(-)
MENAEFFRIRLKFLNCRYAKYVMAIIIESVRRTVTSQINVDFLPVWMQKISRKQMLNVCQQSRSLKKINLNLAMRPRNLSGMRHRTIIKLHAAVVGREKMRTFRIY